jgi:hypothetical protein
MSKLKLLIACIASILVIYLCFSVITMQLNLSNWDIAVRAGFVFVSFCSLWFVAVLYIWNHDR